MGGDKKLNGKWIRKITESCIPVEEGKRRERGGREEEERRKRGKEDEMRM